MKKVISNKAGNDPSKFKNYSYRRYTRSELDVDNIDYQKIKGNSIRSVMLNTYASIDSNAKNDKELPIYLAAYII